jgi:hypothetical protein
MAIVKYVGPHIDGVDVQVSPGQFVTAAHGEPVDLPDAIAKELTATDNWESESPRKKGGD